MIKRFITSLLCLSFIFSNLQYVQASDFSVNQLPVPGTMVGESAPFAPLALKGLIVNPQKPLEFRFIVDTGKGPQDTASVKGQANQLVKYFLAGLTIPEGDLWVNLSPYEKNRMVPMALGQTDLGRDLLAQDYILKQLTASLIYPEKDLGMAFWSRVYAKAQQQFGTTNVPVNTFNKVWILPDQAQVFENHNAAYVTQSTLKVMLDEDYLSLKKHTTVPNGMASVGANIVREIVIPEITKEVNTGKNFALLRQIYQALILAKWYKETIQNGLLDALYTNKNKVAGVNLDDPTVKEQIYQRYLQAYKKGAFNYIKEDPAPDGQVISRKYFSGGLDVMPLIVDRKGTSEMVSTAGDEAMLMDVDLEKSRDKAMLDPDTAREVIEAYRNRGKGDNESAFVDHTRSGAYLKINPTTGEVWQISPEEYEGSSLTRYNDGYEVDDSSNDDAMTVSERIMKLIEELNDKGIKPKIHDTDLLIYKGREDAMLKFIQDYSVLKDPDDIRRLLLWRFNMLGKGGKPLSGVNPKIISLLYNSIFDQDLFLKEYTQEKPLNVVLYRRGHSGSELTGLLNSIPGVNIKIILSATDDGLSWFHAAHEFADTGAPGAGKALLDLSHNYIAKKFLELRIKGKPGQSNDELTREFNILIDHLKDPEAKSRLSDEMFEIYEKARELPIKERKIFTEYMDRFRSEFEKYRMVHPESRFSYLDIPLRSIVLQGGAFYYQDQKADNPWQEAVNAIAGILNIDPEHNKVLFPTVKRQHIVALREDGTLYLSETGINQYETGSPFLGIWLLKNEAYQHIKETLEDQGIALSPLSSLKEVNSQRSEEILSTTWVIKGNEQEGGRKQAFRAAELISKVASTDPITDETKKAIETADVIFYADAWLETNVGGAVIVKGTEDAIKNAANHKLPEVRQKPGKPLEDIKALKINLAEIEAKDVHKNMSLDYLGRLNRYISGNMLYKSPDKWKDVGKHVDYVLGGLLGNQSPLVMTDQLMDLESQTGAQVGAVAVKADRDEQYGFFSSTVLKEAIISLLGIKAAGYKIMNNGKLMPENVAGKVDHWPKGQNGLFKTDDKVKNLIGEIKRNWGKIINEGAFVFDVDMTILPKSAKQITDFWELAVLFTKLLRRGVRVAIISGNSEEEQVARIHEAIKIEMKDDLKAMENLTFYVNGGATKIRINEEGERVYDKDYNDAHGMKASIIENAIKQALLKIAQGNFGLKGEDLKTAIYNIKKDNPKLVLSTPWERENVTENVEWEPKWITPKELDEMKESKGAISFPWVEVRGKFISQQGQELIASVSIKPVPNLILTDASKNDVEIGGRDELVSQIDAELEKEGVGKDFYPRTGGTTSIDVTQIKANKPAALEDFIMTSHMGRSGNLKPLDPHWVFYMGDEFFNRMKFGKPKRGNDEDIVASPIPSLKDVRILAVNSDNIEGTNKERTLWIGRTPQATLEFLETVNSDSAMLNQAPNHLSDAELELLREPDEINGFISKRARDDERIKKQVIQIETALGHANQAEQKAEQVIKDLNEKNVGFKGEEVHVLSGVAMDDKVIGRIDRKIAEKYGYAHETANIVILDPDGNVVLQLRNKDKGGYDDHLSVYGGHLQVGESHLAGALDEAKQETGLERFDSPMTYIGHESYFEIGDNNHERRSWFVQRLTKEEWENMKVHKAQDEEIVGASKLKDDRQAYKQKLSQLWGQGKGEVTGVYPVSVYNIERASQKEDPESKLTDKNTRYLPVTDTFNGKTETIEAPFTPDSFDHLVKNPVLWDKIKTIVQVEYQHRLAGPGTSSDYISPEERALADKYHAIMNSSQGTIVDKASIADNGGIDLNQINVKRNGRTVRVQFDPAQLNELENGGFEGFTAVITDMERISSPLPLLGVNSAK